MVPHPYFIKLLFYFKIFNILLWFCIRQAIGFENRISYLKVTANFTFLAQMPQIKKQSTTPIFYEFIVLF